MEKLFDNPCQSGDYINVNGNIFTLTRADGIAWSVFTTYHAKFSLLLYYIFLH